ncbi:14102_t:CDS:2 [Funneliformis caledonium]|uniref:14102_t:CDS:1 n=1 Tax=Funneliformis caledonium TaxID=1117310 RepID=A0A9N9FHB8_9GLOM|nr:14102_t:CDS:2 [Funneliformis caledonium]
MYFEHGKKRKVVKENYEKHETRLSRDRANKKRKAAEKTFEKHETRLLCNRNRKHEMQQKVEETHEELEARLVTEEETHHACAREKYQLRKARETPKQRVARITRSKSNDSHFSR